jgi:hypothetical protein
MTQRSPLVARLLSGPTSPDFKINSLEHPTADALDSEHLRAWHASLDRYAVETAGGSAALHTLDFSIRDLVISRYFNPRDFPDLLWPSDLYIPGDADYKNYWFFPCPARQRYGREWISGDDVNQASSASGHVWAYTSINQDMPHDHSEAGIGFVFAPQAKLAVYTVKPSLSVLGTYRWSIETSYFDSGGWIFEWGVIYIAAWEINPVDGSLELVKPYGVTTIFNQSWNNQGTVPVTNAVPPWSPGPLSANILLEGGKTYLIGVVAAVDVRSTWIVDPNRWPADSDWRTWCTLDLTVPKIEIDATTIYQP